MKNWEKYEEELKSVGTTSFGITHYDKKVLNCDDMHCSGCIFNKDNLWGDSRLCGYDKMIWLFKDYEEPQPKLTKKEKAFLDGITSVFIYIVRDLDDKLALFTVEPYKINDATWGSWGSCILLNSDMFSFITWSDENPWTIKELKNLEVEDEESYDMSTYVR